jgi:hypothetical protein
MINTPAGIEGMFRHAGHDRATPRPEGFEISPERLVEGANMFGQIILGPPADRAALHHPLTTLGPSERPALSLDWATVYVGQRLCALLGLEDRRVRGWVNLRVSLVLDMPELGFAGYHGTLIRQWQHAPEIATVERDPRNRDFEVAYLVDV